MNNSRAHYVVFVAIAILLAVLTLDLGCMIFTRPHQGSVPIETWIAENKAFKVRVTSYEEKDANVSGTYYAFESSSTNSTGWHKIMTFRHDDRPDIPKDQLRFLNDKIGYVFMGWMYAVTTDGGLSWSVWDAEKDLPNWQCCNYGLISEVTIANDGSGVMSLKPIQDRRGEVPELRTKDYGQHWSAK